MSLDTSPKSLVLNGLVLASALTIANAATGLFTADSTADKLGKVGVAAVFVAGTAIAGNTILKNTSTIKPNPTMKRF